MKMLSSGIAAIAILVLFGFVYMAGEREEAHRLWGVSLEAAVRAGDLDRAESVVVSGKIGGHPVEACPLTTTLSGRSYRSVGPTRPGNETATAIATSVNA